MDSGPGLPLSLSLFWPLFVLLLCAAGLVGWQWLRRRTLPSGRVPLNLLSRAELSPQHVLYLVEVEGHRLLLGGGPGGLSLVSELPQVPAAKSAPELSRELAA